MLGYTVVDPSSVLATHISELIKTHINEIIGRQQVQSLLDRVAEKNPKLVEELVPNLLSLGAVKKVLQNLLREKVSIRNAFIFSSRTIRPKFNSTKKPGSKWVEVTAAVDRNSNNRLQTGFDSSIINSILSDSNAEREKYMKIGGNYVCDSEVPSFTAKFFPYMKQLLLSGFDQDIYVHIFNGGEFEFKR